MAKKEEMGKVPNLRFKGFQGDWTMKKLGDFAPLQRGFDLPVDKIVKGKYPVVFSNGILKFHNEYKIKGPGIVTGRSGTIGKVTFIEEDYWPHNTSLWVTAFNDNEPKFIYHYYSKSKLERFGTGSGVPTLNRNDVHIQIDYFPFIEEQRKISKFLSILDARIQTQSKIIEGIHSLMNGVLKKLSGVSKNKNWEKQFLSDILKERTENNIHGYEIHSVSVSKGVINQIKYLGRSFASKNTSNYGVVHFGDIVYTKSPTGEFPYGIIKQSFINEKVAVSPLYGVFIPVNIALGNILHFYFNNPINTNNYLHSLVQKGAKNTINITNQNFLKKSIYLPTSEKEISSTAGLLIKLKEKIALEQSILDQLVKEKNYLLSRLFI